MSAFKIGKIFPLFILISIFAFPMSASSDEIHPGVYLLVDTSGSMMLTVGGDESYGDGSAEHPAYNGRESRIHMAKSAVSTVVNAYGDVMWGLAKFTQEFGKDIVCRCDSQTHVGPGETGTCESSTLSNDLPDDNNDLVCINYSYNTACDGAQILVPLGGALSTILSWIDNHENDPQAPVGGGTDPEIRAIGATPLGDSLVDMRTQLSTDIPGDPLRGCRPYTIIMLTDGSESCGGDAVAAATNLRSTPGTGETCSNGSQCPSGVCSGGLCRYDVKTYVIAFATSSSAKTAADNIANAGGTGSAIPASNEDELVAAMASIIADSIRVELCNGVDDDCDSLIDEDFPVGDSCDNGLLGECYRAGSYVCSADESGVDCSAPNVAPTAEVCDNLDNDCNGLVDDGITCPTPGPEMCNGLDDDLDGSVADDADDDPSVGVVCGTNEGICVQGVTKCIGGSVISCCVDDGNPAVCVQVQAPEAEVCDTLDNDCDGQVNEGVSQACYPGGFSGCTDNGDGTFTCSGICASGIQLCDTAGNWGSCQGYQTPQSEVCDGADNDCDGSTDEGLGTTDCGLGACYHTINNCSSGVTQTCDPMQGASPETCDNSDEDCDGQVDDGLSQSCYTGGVGTENVGVCHGGTSVCSAGAYGSCNGEVVPSPEVCNNLDDDCDNQTDENLSQNCYSGAAGTENVGLCHGGTQNCTAGSWGACSGEVVPVNEVCDNADNDCNGIADDMGNTTCGLGACQHTVENCTNGTTNSCDPLQGASPETCDNVDNDCDGQIDGMVGQCYPGSTAGCSDNGDGTYSCVGVCGAGMAICTAGSWGSCSGAVTPSTEICDGLDNDCDNLTDEGLGSTTCGLGVCNHTISNCSGGSPQTCDPLQGASPETCDNADNDCNGIVDDGLVAACYNGTSGCSEVPAGSGNWVCQGICSAGTTVCGSGAWGACSGEVQPGTEICNNLDDDCDGSTDEGLSQVCYSGPSGTLGVGVCVSGNQTCSAGTWGSCGGEVTPSSEVCDNLDNDCNGTADDMGTLTCGLGVCNHTVNVCQGGVLQTCDPLQGSGVEICDGLDNDCDGQVDGLYNSCFPVSETGCTWNSGTQSYDCVGVCAPGLDICSVDGTGVWDGCSGAVVPTPEICNNLDDNCDGSVDENLSEQCYPPGSGANTGCIDNGDGTWTCQGECAAGVRDCSGGAWTSCQGLVTPTSEICDGLDNDCDGETDEDGDIPGMGQPCGGVGVCAPGVRACIGGTVVCEGGGDPQPGLCDGLDNNCNGLVDEPEEINEDPAMGAPCGETEGACEEGHNECIDGNVVCVGSVVPTTELCNGLDDNCDGNIDEGDICDPNEICYNADCRNICDPADEQACGAGYTCIEVTTDGSQVENICYPQLAPCGGIYCGEDEVCREGACVNPCEPSPCESYEKCWVNRYAGQVGHENDEEYICFDNSCSAVGHECPSDKMCINHECVDDPCSSEPCEFGKEYCERINCETTQDASNSGDASSTGECTYQCKSIPFCNDGMTYDAETETCVKDTCKDIECDYGKLCVDGACEDDPCAFTNCDWGDACLQGTCITDPCNTIDCPYYTHCEMDQNNGIAWCQPNDGVWTPPIEGDSMTSTGAGLFQCSTNNPTGGSGSNSKIPFVFLALLLGGVALIRRRISFFTRVVNNKAKLLLPIAIISIMGLSGCDYEIFTLSSEGKLEIPDAEVEPDVPDSDVDDDADACIPEEETCNDLDDDCNGIVDDYWTSVDNGGDGHFSDDIFNCGSCGNICAFVHADPLCVDGQCQMGDCDTNWYDYDNDPSTGCETSCIISSGGQEICDGVDNDCNGIVDDNWAPPADGGNDHFMDDPMNCGECGRICAFPNGQGGCIAGDCVLDSCQTGYEDADGQPGNGCECIITGADDSTCDGVDNDCDGSTDEDFAGAECYTGAGCTDNGDGTFSCLGDCATGNAVCLGGQTQCQNQTSPSLEICDGHDNDCDGLTDEGFDTNTDVNNCGQCNHVCTLTGALARCESGTCVVSVCQQNQWNNDGDDSNGCEYSCTLSNNGIERCDDGLDNDCDGLTDEFDANNDVNNCGACGNSCSANAPPHMDVTGCSGGTCQYTCASGYHDFDTGQPGCETYCVVSNGGVEACDGADNNCDGTVDEGFDKNNDPLNCGTCNTNCSDSVPVNMHVNGCSGGVCQYDCDANHFNYDGILSNGCEYSCTISNGGVEQCDGNDNDCDGQVDEDAAGVPLTQSCYTGGAGTEGVGLCHGGTQTCSSGTWGVCGGEVVPSSEICDNLDNNCDSVNDDGFDKNTDILNCGSCGNSCSANAPPNTYTTGCSGGVCQYECKANYYDRNGNKNNPSGDGCEINCVLTNNGIEDCSDGVDNDCDGTTDEFDSNSVNNCGSCGNVCSSSAPPHMDVTGCVSGTCQYTCASGYHDFDGGQPGCETYCVESNGGVEQCDGADNDCDGTVDEGFDTNTDTSNCGSCGYSCSANAPAFMNVTSCTSGSCHYSCQTGHIDLDGISANGCEYSCTVSNGGVEICDGNDNDCDGQTDEDAAGLPLTQSCYTGGAGTEGVGLCHSGTQTCSGGLYGTCFGEVIPTTETCDGNDNDCDSQTDEDFDTNTEILNCGSCGNSCFASVPANAAVSGCSLGVCEYTCLGGYHDIDGNMTSNGCEYQCDQTLPDGQENCNGIDDDCDNQIDEASDLLPPASGYCKTGGGCGSAVSAQCQDFYSDGNNVWVCQYPAQVERQSGSPNGVAYSETKCDGYDNDCNGQIDEDFLPLLGQACDDGDFGLCRGTGTVVCKGDETGTECNITSKPSPQAEVCDDIDNDCDGLTDEPIWNPGSNASYVTDDVKTISVSGHNVFIYTYEASRPNSTGISSGAGQTRACSKSGVLPWNRVTYAQAQEACSEAGMRLCKADEWQEGCEDSGLSYPYGSTYNGLSCNGDDYGSQSPITTGEAAQCYDGGSGTHDQSGNLKEWTHDYRGHTSDNKKLYTLRGGSFYDLEAGLACDFTSSVFIEDVFTDNVGFRCCTTCGNGTLESDELCDDGNRIDGDGCDHFCATESGQTCGNGTVEGTEECDDGNRYLGDGCNASCLLEAGIPICGNGTTDEGEQCDDGNLVDGDGCDSSCQREPVNCGGTMDTFGYEMCTTSNSFTDFRTSTYKQSVSSGTGDDGYYTYSLPFSFNYYGTNYNTMYINTNGTINFSASSSSFGNDALPTGDFNDGIAMYWDDLDLGNDLADGVWVRVYGSAPNRTAMVILQGEHYSSTPNTIVVQAVLHENSGDIDIIYYDPVFGDASYDNGVSATSGIQGSSTSSDGYYLQYSYNAANLTTGLSLTFYHP